MKKGLALHLGRQSGFKDLNSRRRSTNIGAAVKKKETYGGGRGWGIDIPQHGGLAGGFAPGKIAEEKKRGEGRESD